jgi:hypothetical protein
MSQEDSVTPKQQLILKLSRLQTELHLLASRDVTAIHAKASGDIKTMSEHFCNSITTLGEHIGTLSESMSQRVIENCVMGIETLDETISAVDHEGLLDDEEG